VDTIEQNMNNNVDLKFKMILDYSRYLRAADKSRDYLNPLIKKFENRFDMFLYHTPNLRGLAKKWIPERSNETLGVLHMKIYIADDNLIISGYVYCVLNVII
jgi:CDP-diacylglycerol--glycerol-3-phosphate 3-phosphatidyltransferase